MSKNTNATTNATTMTTNANNVKGEKTMKKNTTNATANATTSPMTAQEFKQASYDAYLAYVSFIEGKTAISETVDAMAPLMTAYGFTLTVDNIANLLTVKMTAFGKDKGEQAKKVKSISTFRAFVKGGWQDVMAAPVHSNAGKNPADAKPTAKSKAPTKADLEAQIAALKAQLAAAQPTETTAEEVKAA